MDIMDGSDIQRHTYRCLDFDALLEKLRSETVTQLGREHVENSHYPNAKAVTKAYEMLEQLASQLVLLPLRRKLQMIRVLKSIERNQAPPSREDLRTSAEDIDALLILRQFLDENVESLSLFSALSERLHLPKDVVSIFKDSFEPESIDPEAPPRLNSKKYPEIRRCTELIESHRNRIYGILKTLANSAQLKHKLAESDYRVVDGHYCLSVINSYKRGIGIVRGESNSGRTVYVEPFAVASVSEELFEAQTALKKEEQCIFFQMVTTLAQHRLELVDALQAAAEVDVMRAKIKLAQKMVASHAHNRQSSFEDKYLRPTRKHSSTTSADTEDQVSDILAQLSAPAATTASTSSAASTSSTSSTSTYAIPEVRDEGCIALHSAWHPLLLLSTPPIDVVPHALQLDASQSALVISGPNAGGKTIALKTAGLFALLVRFAVPLPANQMCRFDFFDEVLADIGDGQDVQGAKSTFSAHLLMLKTVLERTSCPRSATSSAADASVEGGNTSVSDDTSSSADADADADAGSDDGAGERAEGSTPRRPSCLVLLDEAGTGTDPAQGAVLAQALLEQLLDTTASVVRLIVTTHYLRIKEVAAKDPRIAIAAMEFINDTPTFRLKRGLTGESFALELAQRLRLPASLIRRAHVLLDDETKRLLHLQRQLEVETQAARQLQQECLELKRALRRREEVVEEAQRVLARQIEEVRGSAQETYLQDIRAQERALHNMILEAKERIARAVFASTSSSSASSTSSPTTSPSTSSFSTSLAGEEVLKEVSSERLRLEKTQAEQDAQTLHCTPLTPLQLQTLAAGQRVVLLCRGTLFGARGIVAQQYRGRGRVLVNVANAEIKVDKHLLALPNDGPASLANSAKGMQRAPSSKERRLQEMLANELVDYNSSGNPNLYRNRKNNKPKSPNHSDNQQSSSSNTSSNTSSDPASTDGQTPPPANTLHLQPLFATASKETAREAVVEEVLRRCQKEVRDFVDLYALHLLEHPSVDPRSNARPPTPTHATKDQRRPTVFLALPRAPPSTSSSTSTAPSSTSTSAASSPSLEAVVCEEVSGRLFEWLSSQSLVHSVRLLDTPSPSSSESVRVGSALRGDRGRGAETETQLETEEVWWEVQLELQALLS